MSMRQALLLIVSLLSVALLAGCAATPGVPETTYFRLPARAAQDALPVAPIAGPVMVDPFVADGVHVSQALLYSTDPGGERLRAYHYQLWVDPPTRMLQRRLIATLREAGVAAMVDGSLPPSRELTRVHGRIEAFERVRRDDGWHVQVALQLRVDHGDEARPRLLRDYRREQRADGEAVRDSVRAFAAAVDSIYAEFIADLVQQAPTR
jgi:cholesterol transport system auxiliary component